MNLYVTEAAVSARRQELLTQAAQRRLSLVAACCRRWGFLTRRRLAEGPARTA